MQNKFIFLLIILSSNLMANTSTLNILTYNVWHLPQPIAKENVARIKGICEEFKTYAKDKENGPDVILVQEKWYATDDFNDCGYNVADLSDVYTTGLLILSKTKILEMDTYKFAKNGTFWPTDILEEASYVTEKGVLSALIEHPKGNIWVVNTHLVAGYEGNYFGDQRKDQMFEVISYVDIKKPRNSKVILGGDFNAGANALYDGPVSKTKIDNWSSFKYYLSKMHLIQIDDKFLKDTFSEKNNHLSKEEDEGKIDHLFFDNKSFEIVNASTALTENHVLSEELNAPFSDHYGWRVKVKIK